MFLFKILNCFQDQLNRIEAKLDALTKESKMQDETLDQVLADVQAESTVEDGLITLTTSIKAELNKALAGSGLSADDQAKVDAIFTAIESNKAKVAAAVTANTPAAPAA